MDERLRFVARLLDGEAMSEVCRAFGITRKTGYKIFDHIWQQPGADKKGKGRRGARFAPDSPVEGAVRSEPVCKIGLIPGRFWANSWVRLLKIVKRQHPVVPHRPAWEFLNPCLQGFFTNAGPRWPKNLPSIIGGRSSYARVLDQKQSGLTGTYLSLSCRGIYRDPIATSITIDNCNARPSCSLGQLVPRHGRPRSDLCSWRLQSVVVYERSAYRM